MNTALQIETTRPHRMTKRIFVMNDILNPIEITHLSSSVGLMVIARRHFLSNSRASYKRGMFTRPFHTTGLILQRWIHRNRLTCSFECRNVGHVPEKNPSKRS